MLQLDNAPQAKMFAPILLVLVFECVLLLLQNIVL